MIRNVEATIPTKHSSSLSPLAVALPIFPGLSALRYELISQLNRLQIRISKTIAGQDLDMDKSHPGPHTWNDLYTLRIIGEDLETGRTNANVGETYQRSQLFAFAGPGIISFYHWPWPWP